MIGSVEKDTLGNAVFWPWSCPYCQLDTAGNHEYNCPNRHQDALIETTALDLHECAVCGRVGLHDSHLWRTISFPGISKLFNTHTGWIEVCSQECENKAMEGRG